MFTSLLMVLLGYHAEEKECATYPLTGTKNPLTGTFVRDKPDSV